MEYEELPPQEDKNIPLPNSLPHNTKLSWADIVEQSEENEECSLIDKQPPPIYIPSPTISNETESNESEYKKCHICNISSKAARYIIEECNEYVFSFDLWKRSYIIVNPKRHCEDIHELSPQNIYTLFETIDKFMKNNQFKGYQIIMQHGDWKNQTHFSIKIKCDKKILNLFRESFFKRKYYKDIYKKNIKKTQKPPIHSQSLKQNRFAQN